MTKKVFLAYSFDKEKRDGLSMSDYQLGEWFCETIKNSKLNWSVQHAVDPEPRPIYNKVMDGIGGSNIVIVIFTARSLMAGTGNKVPPLWLLSEGAYAMGRLNDQYQNHRVFFFIEDGIDPNSLGLISAGGQEMMRFNRNNLKSEKRGILSFLGKIDRAVFGEVDELQVGDGYVQTSLHKIFLVYRNGFGTVHNIVDIRIKDAERFSTESSCCIRHRIWTHFGKFPSFGQMLDVPIHERKSKAFFYGMLTMHGNKNMNTPLYIAHGDTMHTNTREFDVKFLNQHGEPLKFKVNDTVRYQYAWGLPQMFPLYEDDLEKPVSDEITTKAYCLAELDNNHGKIGHATLEVRFERDAKHGCYGSLFSKTPISIATRAPRHPNKGVVCEVLNNLKPVKQVVDGGHEFDMWYERYIVNLNP